MDTPEPDELTLHEVAEILDVHYMTAYRYVRLGILPARREGRSWRIDRSDVDRLAIQIAGVNDVLNRLVVCRPSLKG